MRRQNGRLGFTRLNLIRRLTLLVFIKRSCVNPHLAVGWAGDYLIARHVIQALPKLPRDKYTVADVLDFIKNLGLRVRPGTSSRIA